MHRLTVSTSAELRSRMCVFEEGHGWCAAEVSLDDQGQGAALRFVMLGGIASTAVRLDVTGFEAGGIHRPVDMPPSDLLRWAGREEGHEPLGPDDEPATPSTVFVIAVVRHAEQGETTAAADDESQRTPPAIPIQRAVLLCRGSIRDLSPWLAALAACCPSGRLSPSTTFPSLPSLRTSSSSAASAASAASPAPADRGSPGSPASASPLSPPPQGSPSRVAGVPAFRQSENSAMRIMCTWMHARAGHMAQERAKLLVAAQRARGLLLLSLLRRLRDRRLRAAVGAFKQRQLEHIAEGETLAHTRGVLSVVDRRLRRRAQRQGWTALSRAAMEAQRCEEQRALHVKQLHNFAATVWRVLQQFQRRQALTCWLRWRLACAHQARQAACGAAALLVVCTSVRQARQERMLSTAEALGRWRESTERARCHTMLDLHISTRSQQREAAARLMVMALRRASRRHLQALLAHWQAAASHASEEAEEVTLRRAAAFTAVAVMRGLLRQQLTRAALHRWRQVAAQEHEEQLRRVERAQLRKEAEARSLRRILGIAQGQQAGRLAYAVRQWASVCVLERYRSSALMDIAATHRRRELGTALHRWRHASVLRKARGAINAIESAGRDKSRHQAVARLVLCLRRNASARLQRAWDRWQALDVVAQLRLSTIRGVLLAFVRQRQREAWNRWRQAVTVVWEQQQLSRRQIQLRASTHRSRLLMRAFVIMERARVAKLRHVLGTWRSVY